MLDLARFNGFVETMFGFAMAITLFMAGMELDFKEISGRPLTLASRAGRPRCFSGSPR